MSHLLRAVATVLAVVFLAAPTQAATQEQIDAAIARGAAYLKQRPLKTDEIGPVALVGLAVLESGARFDEPAVKAITNAVRARAYYQERTYPISLCLMYLDRNGDPADIALIQALAMRLLAGQTNGGGWGYSCTDIINQGDAEGLATRLKTAKVEPGKLCAEVAAYARTIKPAAQQLGDDNSNTQFGVIGLWVARKHGVPVEAALDLVVEKFIRSQDAATGGWPYSGIPGQPNAPQQPGSPSMTCAGLIALATGAARRDERLLKSAKKEPEPMPKSSGNPSDPFFTPGSGKPADKQPKRAPDRIDYSVSRAYMNLSAAVSASARAGNGSLVLIGDRGHGDHDLYFYWSMERVGVVYGWEKIGGVDWYAAGANTLVRAQAADGHWQCGYGDEVGTAFAMLFLLRSNVVKDLKMNRNSTDTELRSTASGNPMPDPKSPMTNVGTEIPPKPMVDLGPKPTLPLPVENESGRMAKELLDASPSEWDKRLAKVRDTRGGDYTGALVLAIPRLDGDRKTDARDALAERLVRMNVETLRGMMKSSDPELRRGAVLAAAMKDEKAHIPDLIDRLLDEEELVVRAARAGLKSLSDGKDFGPPNGATKAEREAAAKVWRDWASKK